MTEDSCHFIRVVLLAAGTVLYQMCEFALVLLHSAELTVAVVCTVLEKLLRIKIGWHIHSAQQELADWFWKWSLEMNQIQRAMITVCSSRVSCRCFCSFDFQDFRTFQVSNSVFLLGFISWCRLASAGISYDYWRGSSLPRSHDIHLPCDPPLIMSELSFTSVIWWLSIVLHYILSPSWRSLM